MQNMRGLGIIAAATMLAAGMSHMAEVAEGIPTPAGETKYSAKRGKVYSGNGAKEVEKRRKRIAAGKPKVSE